MSRTARAVSPADPTDDQLGRQALRGDREAFMAPPVGTPPVITIAPPR